MRIYLAVMLTLIAYTYAAAYLDKHIIHFPVCRGGQCGSGH